MYLKYNITNGEYQMKTSESIKNISKALSLFQSEVKQPEKDGSNPHFRSKYVTLDGTVKAIHDCAHKFGLSYTQSLVSEDNGLGVITLIMHESGEYIQFSPLILPVEKKTAQSLGSSATYARRYSLSSAFGIVSDVDDDGNEATKSAPHPAESKQVGDIKVLCKVIAKLKNVGELDILRSAVGNETAEYSFLEILTKRQSDDLLAKLEKWEKQAGELLNKDKEEVKGE